ncbi:MAG: hypothetical protein K0B14_18315 [Anaerolineaceae bacterium]|nr:hypothetical protein [Anaerolineaceae bacterium]
MFINSPELTPKEIQHLQERNKKVFQPEVLSANMLFYSTYIAIFEIFKQTLVTNIKNFFWVGFIDDKDRTSPNYKSEVLERINKKRLIDERKIRNLFMASCDWAFENKLLTLDQYKSIDELTKYRNTVTHEMATQIYDEKVRPDFSIFEELINTFSHYVYEWFMNVEFDLLIDELENKEITYEEFSKYNPFGLVWLCANFASMVEYRENGFLYMRDRSQEEISESFL